MLIHSMIMWYFRRWCCHSHRTYHRPAGGGNGKFHFPVTASKSWCQTSSKWAGLLQLYLFVFIDSEWTGFILAFINGNYCNCNITVQNLKFMHNFHIGVFFKSKNVSQIFSSITVSVIFFHRRNHDLQMGFTLLHATK